MEKMPAFMKALDQYYESRARGALTRELTFDSNGDFVIPEGQEYDMELPEYNFWLNRYFELLREIADGESNKKSILEMPVSLMLKIAGNLDPVERTALRSVSRAMKDVADVLPPTFESISIAWNHLNTLKWKFNENPTEHSGHGKLEKLSRTPGFKVNNLILRSLQRIGRLDDEGKLGDVLPESCLNSKNVDISSRTVNDAIQLLSIAKPGDLESIRLWPTDGENFSRIFDTEQFKQAKHVEIISLKGFNASILSNFGHLKSFKIKLLGDFVEEDFLKIRDIISSFEEFETCQLGIVDLSNHFDVRNISKALETKIPFGPLRTINHRYQIPKSKNCLDFKIEDGGSRISMKITKIC
ncbi:unnamed protein product [Caenorhabditis nigoni]